MAHAAPLGEHMIHSSCVTSLECDRCHTKTPFFAGAFSWFGYFQEGWLVLEDANRPPQILCPACSKDLKEKGRLS